MIQYQYDAAGQRVAEVWLDAQQAAIHTVAYAYDDAGRLTSASDPNSSYAMSYQVVQGYQHIATDNAGTPGVPRVVLGALFDADGRLIEVTDADANFYVDIVTLTEGSGTANEVQQLEIFGGAVGPTLQLEFDGQTTPLLETGISAAAVEAALEALSNIGAGNVSVSGDRGGPWTIQFTGSLALQDVAEISPTTQPTGAAIGYGYTYGQLQNIQYTQIGVTGHTVEYAMGDNFLWPTQIRRYADTTSSDPVATDLGYDLLGQVTSIDHSYNSTALASFAYTYNADHELTSYTGPEGTVTYAYDDTHQLTSASGARSEAYTWDANGNPTMTGYSIGLNNRLLSDGVYNYGYDDEGNRTTRTHIVSGEVTEYTWDHRNRLTKVVIKNSSGTILREARFTYDVFNNLIIRWTDMDGAGSQPAEEMFTVYNGAHAWADFNGEGELLHHHLYGAAVDQLLATIDADGDPTWHLTDNLGSVRLSVDDIGNILNETEFDSFGNILAETNPSSSPRQSYTARELERSIGLLWYRARWYDPAVGRFLSEDPIGTISDINLNRYVGNSPTILTDPLGLWAEGIYPWDALIGVLGHIGEIPASIHEQASGARTRAWTTFQNSDNLVDQTAALMFGIGYATIGEGFAYYGLIEGLNAPARAMEGLVCGVRTTPSYRGNNPVRASGNRVNTDLPGGQAAAQRLFDRLTGGNHVVDPRTGHLVGPNGHRLRLSNDGRWRVDVPAENGLLHETIHFNN